MLALAPPFQRRGDSLQPEVRPNGTPSAVLLVVLLALALPVSGRPPLRAPPAWECDPIVPGVCGLPFPSDFNRGADGRLNLTVNTFPTDQTGKHINPEIGGWNTLDGFSGEFNGTRSPHLVHILVGPVVGWLPVVTRRVSFGVTASIGGGPSHSANPVAAQYKSFVIDNPNRARKPICTAELRTKSTSLYRASFARAPSHPPPPTPRCSLILPTADPLNYLASPAEPSIITFVPDVSIASCPRLWDMGASLETQSPTAVIEARTGRVIAHWVELDESDSTMAARDRLMMIWPAERLNDGERYLVAIRGLVNTAGEPIIASDAFRALRDNMPSSDPVVNGRRSHYEGLFGIMAKQGWRRGEILQLWDFTVMSTHTQTGRALSMRDDALDRIAAKGIPFRILHVSPRPPACTVPL